MTSDDICDDNAFTSVTYPADVLFTYRDVVVGSHVHHKPSSQMLDLQHTEHALDDCPSLVSDFDDRFSSDYEDDLLQVAIRN
jgi:hypothetical protein